MRAIARRVGARPWASLAVLFVSACCSGGSTETSPAPGPPTFPATPVVPAEPGAPPAPACIAYCERLLACHLELGTTARDAERDCHAACAPGGAYAGLTPDSWAGSDRPACSEVWACSATDMAGQLVGSLAPTPAPGTLPADWPADFPAVAGGTAMPSPPMGPVHVAILAYAGQTPTELADAYRAALVAAGWRIPEGGRETDEDADRFIAMHGTVSVSVSVYREGTQTYVQTMQLGSLFPH